MSGDSRKHGAIDLGVRQKLAKAGLRLLGWKAISWRRWTRVKVGLSNSLFSIFGGVLAIFLYTPSAQNTIEKFTHFDSLFPAAGALIGTIVAIVFSLSFIPVQRAAEAYSPSLASIYSSDNRVQSIFVALALFTVLSFVAPVDGIVGGVHPAKLLPLEVAAIAITFDLLRWNYRIVSRMLDPIEAIGSLVTLVKKGMDIRSRNVKWMAAVRWFALSPAEKKATNRGMTEAAIYIKFPGFEVSVLRLTSELAEIARKSVAASEVRTARYAIGALGGIALHYLDTRKGSLLIHPTSFSPFAPHSSDADSVLKPIYEELRSVNKVAISAESEMTSIEVAASLARIAQHMLTLPVDCFGESCTRLVWSPVGYLSGCVIEGQAAGFDDLALQGSRYLLEITQQDAAKFSVDVSLAAIDMWNRVAIQSFMRSKTELVNEVLSNMMTSAHTLMGGFDAQTRTLLSMMFRHIRDLVPMAVLLEKAVGANSLNTPCSAPYDLTKKNSIGYLVDNANLIGENDVRPHANPYSKLLELDEAISGHFLDLASNVDFGSSLLLNRIINTIEYIVIGRLKIIRSAKEQHPTWVDKLESNVSAYTCFYWQVFRKAQTVDQQRAQDAGNALACIGLSYYEAGIPVVAEHCASGIASIAESTGRRKQGPNSYDVADLLVLVWHIHRLASERGDTTFCDKISKHLLKPQSFQDTDWIQVQEALDLRKSQIEDDLQEFFSGSMLRDDPTSVLKRCLYKRREPR